ncbi:hypothetical protein CEE44_04665 [Candidatus Woesearchaeota archaeon B3_Woes]|nr:MAG: hypothetical protein CEE44_04665 [Candidatus Woesearchaeota archaeon B3_Woes]
MKEPNKAVITFLTAASIASAANKPTANIDLTEIVSNEQKPISRIDALVPNLTNNLSLIMFMQHSGDEEGDKDFYRAIIQYLPINGKYKGIEYNLGLSAQHFDGTRVDAHQEAGLVLSLSGKPTENTFMKGIARYYPSKNNIHSFIVASINGVKADVLSSLSVGGEGDFVRYALNIPLKRNIAFRLEGQHNRINGNLKSSYGGFGVQAKF